ncbi:MAG: UvrD-helicase domain-containing protein [Desulfobacterales bacterium]|nr:UvrD-helicase domain-containing protein [Desulfobacterales bacterium]
MSLTGKTLWEIVLPMTFVADLHTHSHFSRATSRDLIPEELAYWAQKKGISVIGTGDFTHPGWLAELQEKLTETENGLYRLRPELEKAVEERVPESCRSPVRFLLTGEISCIYKRGGKTRKIHNLILLPDFDAALRLSERLRKIGNVTSDGRPILGLDSRDLLEIVMEVSPRSFFIPAHIWTPWFSLFGSKSGFESLEECFGDLSPHIHALETGLSSDPPMNRRLAALDDYLLVSNSDAHSPSKLGREANIFDTPMDYDHMIEAMTRKTGFEGTLEFFPEEGKYHYDGHRKCRVSLHPSETREHQGNCPGCGKPLTVGVLHRVFELSDRETPQLSKAFYSLIPLSEILSELLDCGPSTKKVTTVYDDLLVALGPELRILKDAPPEEIEVAGGPLLREAIARMRKNQVIKQEGYDGEYGVIRLFDEAEKMSLSGQIGLFGIPKKTGGKKERLRSIEGFSRKERPEPPPAQKSLPADPVLDPLNPAQREAVLYQGSHLLIVAGPGTGKTMTLTHRIAHLIHSGQAGPDRILALTFTNKAAGEMAERLAALLPERLSDGIRVATFHRFCLEVLRQEGTILDLPSGFTLCPEMDAEIMARQVFSEAGKGQRTVSRFLKDLPRMKMASLTGEGKDSSQDPSFPLFQEYQQRLRTLGMLDLADLEVEALRLFRGHPHVARSWAERFPWIFVDEYQDTNPLQVAILKSLVFAFPNEPAKKKAVGSNSSQFTPCAPAHNGIFDMHHAPCIPRICAIGDPDQAIYGFRGADVGNFHRFPEDFPGTGTITLSRNYRSTQNVLDASSALLEKKQPPEGVLGKGDPISLASCQTQAEEAEMIVERIERLLGGTAYFSLDSGRVSSQEKGEDLGFGDIAVLFRLNAQGQALEEAFLRAGIPFVRSGEKPLISQYPVNVLWRFLQVLSRPDNAHYRAAYLSLLKEYGLLSANISASFPFTGRGIAESMEDAVGPATAPAQRFPEVPLPLLLDRAVASHILEDLPQESANALRRLRDLARDFHGDLASFLDALSLERGIDHAALPGDRVALMSLHAAKGLEWPVVFITGCEEGLIPCTLFGDHNEEEERRLLYVGMTRARSTLILTTASRRTLGGRTLSMKPSPFIRMIPEALLTPLDRGSWKPKKKPHKQLGLF